MYFFKEEPEYIKEYLNKIINRDIKTLNKKELDNFTAQLEESICKHLPAFASVCNKNPLVLAFLKQDRLIPFWDKTLRYVHKLSQYMTDDWHEQRPQNGIHSLDLILGYYYYANARIIFSKVKNMQEELSETELFKQEKINDDIEYAEDLLSISEKYFCFPGMQFAIHGLLPKINNASLQQDKEFYKNKLLEKIEVLIRSCHGTPAYICAAYMLVELAKQFRQEKNFVMLCYSGALQHIYTAQWVEEVSEASICNAYKDRQWALSNPYGFSELKMMVSACEEKLSSLDRELPALQARDEAKRFKTWFKKTETTTNILETLGM